jgi:hypothetical protein
LQEDRRLIVRRIAGDDTFIPLGPAANEVLLQIDDIVTAAEKLAGEVPA